MARPSQGEWEEALWKARFVKAAVSRDLRLIETVLWDGQRRAALAAASGAAAAAVPGCWAGLAARLLPGGPDHPARLRLTLDREGAVEWQIVGPCRRLPRRSGVSGWPSQRLWSRRSLADGSNPPAARPMTRRGRRCPSGLDEVIFLNERGEVCDGIDHHRVFFDRGRGCGRRRCPRGFCPGCCGPNSAAPRGAFMAKTCQRCGFGSAMRCAG